MIVSALSSTAAARASIDRRTSSSLLIQTYSDGGEEVKATLDGLVDFLVVVRQRSGDLDLTLILLAILDQVLHARDLSRLGSLAEVMRTPPSSKLWIDERTIAQRTGLSLPVVRRKVSALLEDMRLLRRDGVLTIHPDAISDPLFGLDEVMRLSRRF